MGDTAYNLFAVDFANSNDFTRNIAGWLKEKKDDLDICWQQTKDYWQHGNGVYILNKIKQGIKVGLAVVGVCVALGCAFCFGLFGVGFGLVCLGRFVGGCCCGGVAFCFGVLFGVGCVCGCVVVVSFCFVFFVLWFFVFF